MYLRYVELIFLMLIPKKTENTWASLVSCDSSQEICYRCQ